MSTNAPAPQSPSSDSARRSVLVVDDNRDAAESLGELLRRWGYDVRVAYDAASAIALIAERAPDVALLDIGLPGMDGYQLSRACRALPTMRSSILVALTGYGELDDVELSLEAGFDHHLLKPVDFESLKKILRGP